MKAKNIFFGLLGSLVLFQWAHFNLSRDVSRNDIQCAPGYHSDLQMRQFGMHPFRFFLIDKTLPPIEVANELRLVQNPPDTCDNPDASPRCCFVGMPDSLTSEMKIAGKDEPGERLFIRGRVFKADGKTPYPNVLIYAYHTDSKGIYSKKGDETGIRRWHGRLYGWCRTDAEGWFSIRTIRPASYPDSRNAAHIHHVVQEPDGGEPYYINDTVFDDDPYVDKRYRANETKGGHSSGIVKLQRQADGVLKGQRFILLK